MTSTLLKYHNENRCNTIFDAQIPALKDKLPHINGVVETSEAIAKLQHSAVDLELLRIVAEHHDDGRVPQFELLGKFWDTQVHHCTLGASRLENFMIKNNLKSDHDVEICRKVMLYHGRLEIISSEELNKISDEEREYIEIVSAADDVENATSWISYIPREIMEDSKGYCHTNPGNSQTEVSSHLIWANYASGRKYDKNVHCHTYADYTLFAAMLTTNCIMKYGQFVKEALLKPAYGYVTRLEGIRQVFEFALTSADSVKAFDIMCHTLGVPFYYD